ncbi:hypothetical protein WDV85_14490 [Pseudokineococcus sp. 5B2Z-1]|uniref:hypothetical protein n=1 Tax=Pseudokineococcus sp. 5B2Z-1 TaxID=3132744 RepID=UPI0030AD56FC
MRSELRADRDAGALLLRGEALPSLGDASHTRSGALAWVIDHGFEERSDQHAREQAQAKAISQDLSALSSTPVSGPLVGAGWGLGQVVSQVQQRIEDVDWGADFSTLYEDTATGLERTFVADLFATGLVTEDSFASANGPPSVTTYVPPPPGAFVTVEGQRLLDPTSAALLRWAEKETDRPGEEHATIPFHTAFPRYVSDQ